MSSESKSFLGIGWKFPITINTTQHIEMSRYEQDIEESIYIILGTSKGERVMRPDFGCGIHDYVFESINVRIMTKLKLSIEEALTRWEPRIELISVTVSDLEAHNGKLQANIDYRIRTTNNQKNLVYDFYLKEGQ